MIKAKKLRRTAMGKERASTCSSSSNSSKGGDACSSSSTSSGATSTSASPSSSLYSSSSSSGTDAKLSSHKRRRSRSQSAKSSHSSRRESAKKHYKEGHTSCKSSTSGKKRRKHRYDMEPNGKSNQKTHKKRLKRRKSDKESTEKTRSHKLRDFQNDSNPKERTNSLLEVTMNAQEQHKAIIRRNAEIAKARLESGELQKAREEQSKMHQLYGTVDWRAKKKLRTEKKMLERTVAAGKKLASLEQREYARMDAFRVALGLPTAEAQRQAEWRAEATQALLELETGSKHATPAGNNRCKRSKHGLIGPTLPP